MSSEAKRAIENGRKLLLLIGGTCEESWAQSDKPYEHAAELADALAQLVGYPEYDDEGCRTVYRQPIPEPSTPAAKAGDGWMSVEDNPLVPGERRVMAVEILRNGVPDWDVFVAAVCEEYDDEWSSEYHDPGWAPSEVSYSMSIGGLPSLPAPPSPEANVET